MPKRKSPEVPEGKEAPKITKQEPELRRSERLNMKSAASQVEVKSTSQVKKTVVKKVAEEKGTKAKKGGAKGKKEDGPAQNGDTKTNEETEAAEDTTEEKA